MRWWCCRGRGGQRFHTFHTPLLQLCGACTRGLFWTWGLFARPWGGHCLQGLPWGVGAGLCLGVCYRRVSLAAPSSHEVAREGASLVQAFGTALDPQHRQKPFTSHPTPQNPTPYNLHPKLSSRCARQRSMREAADPIRLCASASRAGRPLRQLPASSPAAATAVAWRCAAAARAAWGTTTTASSWLLPRRVCRFRSR